MGLMLEKYSDKRDFSQSPEPRPQPQGNERSALIFVVQKHNARRLHYDFRLEVDGVLKSWSVPKGPSFDPQEKRLAVMVEDHPLEYASFEGIIPHGQYGAGQVIVWDKGTYSPDENGLPPVPDYAEAQERIRQGLASDKLSLFLRGRKLKGSWTLVKMQRGDNWLLMKHHDEFADRYRDILQEDRSVLSGLTIADLQLGHLPDPSRSLSFPAELPGARHVPFPSSVAPMLATLTTSAFSNTEWYFEPKLDGVRAIAIIRNGKVNLQSRRGLDITHQYPSLVKDLTLQTEPEMMLDGEIVALDESGRPSFQRLQQRLHLPREADIRKAEEQIPVLYYVFDILYLNGYDIRGVALKQRKELLVRVLEPTQRVLSLDYFEADGDIAYQSAIDQGLEGIVAKHRDSTYESGRRSRLWLKVKATLSDEFVVGGYSQGLGGRADTLGALLLGYFDDRGRLVYVGHVGTGFDDTTLGDLRRRLESSQSEGCPFIEIPPLNAPTTWVRPQMVVLVEFIQWTPDGRLREPVFRGLREDKSPQEVRRSEVASAPNSRLTTSGPLNPLGKEANSLVEQLGEHGDQVVLETQGHKIPITSLEKKLWPAWNGHPAITKRDLLIYLARVSPHLLNHLRDRPLTLARYPDGTHGEHFYQRHWDNPLPEFVETVRLFSDHKDGDQDYILCNNLATLMWLGQLADIELHTWFSRTSREPDGRHLSQLFTGSAAHIQNSLLNYPDFLVFDLDPYIYSGREPKNTEPELNRHGFAATCRIALELKDILGSLSLSSFLKTSGRTGLHVYVPILRQFDFEAVRAATESIGRFLLRRHPSEVTLDWPIERRTGKVFLDHNQNMRGKTLACAYSPRPTPEATVSMPLRWNELDRIYPTDFTILTAPQRLTEVGDLWAGILEAKHDLKELLEMADR